MRTPAEPMVTAEDGLACADNEEEKETRRTCPGCGIDTSFLGGGYCPRCLEVLN